MPVLVTDSPFHDDDGRPAGMVRVVTDLSLRRKAEETQRLLADAGAVLAGSLDYTSTLRALSRIVVPALADCCIVDVLGEDGRPERTEISHVNPAQELLAREMRERYPIDPDSPDHPTAQVLRTGRPRLFTTVPEETVRRIAFDKEHLARMRELNYRSVMVVPLRASGRTLGSLSFFIAGSNRRYGEEDLALAEDLARRAATAIEHARLYEQALLANQAKADFLAVMSHELRTPLTTVMGYADLLLGGLPEPIGDRAHVYVERLRGAAAHLLGLIDQILVYARLDLGRAELHPERALVGDLLRDAAALIEPVAAERGIAFHVDPPEPHTIETDITKLRQILLNLLANAVKFTDEGEVRMCARREGREIVFEVRDTGIGIEPDQMDRVFDPFWQVDQSATRRVGGTGLGLSVSRRLARFLGGDVTVASQAGAGTSFFVRLPERWTPPPPAASTASALTTARR
jgi:signal transduction histidine kinase